MNCKHALPQATCAMCNPSKDISISLTNFARRYQDLNSKELATKALDKMTEHQKHKLLFSLLKNQFENIKRGAVREIEIIATPYEREKREQDRRTRAEATALRNSNKDYYIDHPWAASSGKVYESWVARGPVMRKIRLEKEAPEYAKFLKDKGITDYLYSYNSYGMEKAFKDFEDSVRREITLELTEELLVSSFTLPDNRCVTWGEATVEDHEVRVNMLLTQAGGTVDTAKRHKAAVIMITSHHLTKLNEVAAK